MNTALNVESDQRAGNDSCFTLGLRSCVSKCGSHKLMSWQVLQVDLTLSCHKLAHRDRIGGTSDAFCVVAERDEQGIWREAGRTEVVTNNRGEITLCFLTLLQRRLHARHGDHHNDMVVYGDVACCCKHCASRKCAKWGPLAHADPVFVATVPASYRFEKQQRFKVTVYDADERGADVQRLQLAQQDHLGSTEFDLADVVRSKDGCMRQQLVGQGARGMCTVHAEERAEFRKILVVDATGYKLLRSGGCACMLSRRAAMCLHGCTIAARERVQRSGCALAVVVHLQGMQRLTLVPWHAECLETSLIPSSE